MADNLTAVCLFDLREWLPARAAPLVRILSPAEIRYFRGEGCTWADDDRLHGIPGRDGYLGIGSGHFLINGMPCWEQCAVEVGR